MAAPELPNPFGRYRIVRPLGRGGMGSVYLAHDSQLDRQVALKVPHLSGKKGDRVTERFYREARAAATLDHPNLCPVYDVGEIDGVPYLTMAYIEGRRLADYLPPGRALPQRSAAALVRKLALALAEAHAKGVVHRDLKPDNVMVNQRKEPVIMDFGLARLAAQPDARLTRVGAVLGTPSYMAPEQVTGDLDAMGPGCDVYSLGVMLYEMLTGRLPFEGPTAAVLGQILVAEPTPPSELRADLDPKLGAICARAMAKKPPDRYPSMAEMATALEDYLRAAAASGGVAPAGAVRPASPAGGESLAGQLFVDIDQPVTKKRAPSTMRSSRPPVPTASRGTLLAWLIGVGLLGVLVLAGVAIAIAFTARKGQGTVVVEVNEPGAAVMVDGQHRATVGSLGDSEPVRIRLEEGSYELTVTKAGFVPHAQSFTLTGEQALSLRVRLERAGRKTRDDQTGAQIQPGGKGTHPKEKAGATRPPDPLVVGRWVSILPTEAEVARTNFASYKDGSLEIRTQVAAGFGSGRLGYEAKNGSIRVEVNKLAGQSMQLCLRRKNGRGYTAFFNGGRDFGIGMMVREGGEWKFNHLAAGRAAEPISDFFEFTFKAQGDLLTVEADGQEVVRARDSTYAEAGEMTFGPYQCTVLIKKAEIKDLGDQVPPPKDKEKDKEQVKDPPVTPVGKWVSILPTEEEAKSSGRAEYKDGALVLSRGGKFTTEKKKIMAKDAMIRVVVKRGGEGSFDLMLRGVGMKYYVASCYGEGRNFSLRHEYFKDGKFHGGPITWGRKAKDADGYFTFTFKVQGELLTVEADGEEVIRLRDSTLSEAGWIGYKSHLTGASVKQAEIKILD